MYAFIHIPKTAGSCLRHMLRRSFGPAHLDIKAPLAKRASHDWIAPDDLRRARRVYPNLAGICGHRVTCLTGLHEAEPDLRYFTFLREPLARFVSHFHHACRRQPEPPVPSDFLAFCDDPHQRNVQCRWLGGEPDADPALDHLTRHISFVGLTERFDLSVILFRDWLGRDDFEAVYQPRNRRPNRLPFDPLADPTLRAAAEDANAADLVLYDRVSNDLFPAQVRACGRDPEPEVQAMQERNRALTSWREPLAGRLKRNWVYKPLLHLGLA